MAPRQADEHCENRSTCRKEDFVFALSRKGVAARRSDLKKARPIIPTILFRGQKTLPTVFEQSLANAQYENHTMAILRADSGQALLPVSNAARHIKHGQRSEV